ncbi:MAG TPA: Gfo/Idh/MocA family oxidoreductase [Coleofasciculaceae cyanobacterium]|jgi:UDP-2-acetamido-3-amino-2,3-dideoxy-glucuronate N-acetyltransferase
MTDPFEMDSISQEKIAVIGCGNWGRNLVRNFYNLGFLYKVCDLNQETLQGLQKQYKNVQLTTRFDDVFKDPRVDGVVISTPSFTHYELAREALLNGKHVYVEKPVATSADQTLELFALAQEVNRVLMVGHLLLFHPAVNRLRQLIREGYLGEIQSVSSDRLNTNKLRPDKSVIWDLAPHDVSMLAYLLDREPEDIVSVIGYQSREDGLVDDAHIHLVFPEDVPGHIHISWVHPVKQVKLVVRGTERTAMIDDTQGENKLHIFNKDGASHTPHDVIDEFPEYLDIEPLKLECQHFINCIRHGYEPKTDGLNGYHVVRVLELAERKMELIPV